jgi:argininosuccinate lyase
MTAATVTSLADYLASVDADWRKANGYTGRAVHRKAYWRNMAARLIADSVKAIAEKPNDQTEGCP